MGGETDRKPGGSACFRCRRVEKLKKKRQKKRERRDTKHEARAGQDGMR
jgi:hypothetical protein